MESDTLLNAYTMFALVMMGISFLSVLAFVSNAVSRRFEAFVGVLVCGSGVFLANLNGSGWLAPVVLCVAGMILFTGAALNFRDQPAKSRFKIKPSAWPVFLAGIVWIAGLWSFYSELDYHASVRVGLAFITVVFAMVGRSIRDEVMTEVFSRSFRAVMIGTVLLVATIIGMNSLVNIFTGHFSLGLMQLLGAGLSFLVLFVPSQKVHVGEVRAEPVVPSPPAKPTVYARFSASLLAVIRSAKLDDITFTGLVSDRGTKREKKGAFVSVREKNAFSVECLFSATEEAMESARAIVAVIQNTQPFIIKKLEEWTMVRVEKRAGGWVLLPSGGERVLDREALLDEDAPMSGSGESSFFTIPVSLARRIATVQTSDIKVELSQIVDDASAKFGALIIVGNLIYEAEPVFKDGEEANNVLAMLVFELCTVLQNNKPHFLDGLAPNDPLTVSVFNGELAYVDRPDHAAMLGGEVFTHITS